MATEPCDIAVLGAGPAGAAAALGLAALGYAVTVIAAPDPPRARAARESFSARVVEALRGLGLRDALAAVEAPGRRHVCWAGAERELPGEAQVERSGFDAGLRADLARNGVRVVRTEAARIEASADAVRVPLASGGALAARFAIEARGRAAPSGGARERGPETLCLVQRWRATRRHAAPRIAIASLPDAWLWLADDGAGGIALQLALEARSVPARAQLSARIDSALRADAFCRELLGDAAPEGEPIARAATPVLDGAPIAERALRVGDAALAVDPLSGNGVFQALSSALVAPAVINTLLRAPARAALARSFYAERARDLFERFARVSRDFYALGAAHHGGTFWETRAAWPEPANDNRAAGASARVAPLALATRPVVREGLIEAHEVVVTAERPLGTWHVAGVELAPLLRVLAQSSEASGPKRAAQETRALAALPELAREPVREWLRAHRTGVDALVADPSLQRSRRSGPA